MVAPQKITPSAINDIRPLSLSNFANGDVDEAISRCSISGWCEATFYNFVHRIYQTRVLLEDRYKNQ